MCKFTEYHILQGTLLEYMSCTFEVMDPMEFIQTKESTIGLKVLLQSSTDPKVRLLQRMLHYLPALQTVSCVQDMLLYQCYMRQS